MLILTAFFSLAPAPCIAPSIIPINLTFVNDKWSLVLDEILPKILTSLLLDLLLILTQGPNAIAKPFSSADSSSLGCKMPIYPLVKLSGTAQP